MTDVAEVPQTVNVPQESAALSEGIRKLLVAIQANHKAAPGVPLEISEDVMEAVKDLGAPMQGVGLLSDEAKADPIGVAQAMANGALSAARQMLGVAGA